MSESKLKLLTLKMSEKEIQQLKEDAHCHFMNVSEYVRWLINQERKFASLWPKPSSAPVEEYDVTSEFRPIDPLSDEFWKTPPPENVDDFVPRIVFDIDEDRFKPTLPYYEE